ncbi:uncharacterized protein [Typha angustifolia]|uniref:uncharacterized protein n=1 Tax=Typha angustifolia TaxID=59011 RepID=UPI003C30B93D
MATFGALENIFYNLEKLHACKGENVQINTNWFNVADKNVRELPDEVSTDWYERPTGGNEVSVEESFPSKIKASPEIPYSFNTDGMFIDIDVTHLKTEITGEFENVDLQYMWNDDEDNKLALTSYHEHKNKLYKRKLWLPFIAKLGRSKDNEDAYHVIDVGTHNEQGIFPSSASTILAFDDSAESLWELL